MSQDELLAMPVADWAEDNCHLYLWATNNFITRAGELMAHWGFQHKTVLTWVKPRWGLGSYFRNSTEQLLFGVRGELRTRVHSISTHFEPPSAYTLQQRPFNVLHGDEAQQYPFLGQQTATTVKLLPA